MTSGDACAVAEELGDPLRSPWGAPFSSRARGGGGVAAAGGARSQARGEAAHLAWTGDLRSHRCSTRARSRLTGSPDLSPRHGNPRSLTSPLPGQAPSSGAFKAPFPPKAGARFTVARPPAVRSPVPE